MIHRLRMLRASAERVHRLAQVASNSAGRARQARGTSYESSLTQWASEDLGRLREATRRHEGRIQKLLADYLLGGV